MKKLISHDGDLKTYAELIPLSNPQHQGWYDFRITTIYDTACNPTEEHVKLTWIIDPDAYQKLKELFND